MQALITIVAAMLEYLEHPARNKPRALIFWLHGLGADGYDLEPVAEALGLAGIHHVLPHAPLRQVTINGGMTMRAWYDIAAADLRWQQDADGMAKSVGQLRQLIQHFEQHFHAPVFLAGFSQGAVISLLSAASGIPRLGGVAALSGYVAQSLLTHPKPEPLRNLPIFMAHGVQDEIIPLTLAQQGQASLSAMGAKLAWHGYPMSHSICQQEIADLAEWFETQLAVY